MLRRLYLLIFICLIVIEAFGQRRPVPFHIKIGDLLDSAKKELVYEYHTDYDSSVEVNGFDMINFTVMHESTNIHEGKSVKLHYKDSELKVASFYDTKNELNNYDLFFYPTPDFTYYTAFMYKDYSHDVTNGYFASGFFIRINSTRYSYYIGLDNIIGQEVDFDKGFKLPGYTKPKHIYKVFSFNNSLEPVTRVNFFDGEPMTYSEIEYKNNKVIEKLQVIPSVQSLNKGKLLSQSTLYELLGLVSGESFLCSVCLTVTPKNHLPGLPLWVYFGNEYD